MPSVAIIVPCRLESTRFPRKLLHKIKGRPLLLWVAERIRRRVEAVRVPHLPTQDLQVTLSIGGAYAPQWVRSMPALWTERADQLLYQAKNSGRNKVCLESGLLLDVTVDERRLLFTSPESSESP